MGFDIPPQVILFGMIIFYKVAILTVGLLICHMGFRLFMADKIGPSGDFEGKLKDYSLSLKGGAPGVFFSLFGSILICFSIFKGVQYSQEKAVPAPATAPVKLIPDEPPSGL